MEGDAERDADILAPMDDFDLRLWLAYSDIDERLCEIERAPVRGPPAMPVYKWGSF